VKRKEGGGGEIKGEGEGEGGQQGSAGAREEKKG
jgi:hypothetical protein